MLVGVELFGVSGTALELGTKRATGDQAFAADHADVLAVGQHVEERRLARARRAHERRKLAGADVAKDVVEELALTAGDRDRVPAKQSSLVRWRVTTDLVRRDSRQVLPGEWLASLDQVGQVLLDFALAVTLLVRLQLLVERLALLVLLGKDVDGRSTGTVVELLGEESLDDVESDEEDDGDTL